MSTISNNDIARAIYLVSKEKDHPTQSALAKEVVQFLSRRHLLGKSSDILARLGKIINYENGVTIAKVSSVEKLHEKNKHELTHSLKKRYSAKEVVLEESLDKNLLGGVRIEVNDEVIDLSVKNKILKLKEYLTKSHE